jgi:hypothetical protein
LFSFQAPTTTAATTTKISTTSQVSLCRSE